MLRNHFINANLFNRGAVINLHQLIDLFHSQNYKSVLSKQVMQNKTTADKYVIYTECPSDIFKIT